MATYVAITTTNERQNGWHEVCRGSDKADVRNEAEMKIAGYDGWHKDIYAQTELKNLVVVSKTQAKKYGVDIDRVPDWF